MPADKTIEWAGLGPELLITLDRDRPEPLRTQLETALREAIRAGRLAGGERLPSSRALSRRLGTSRGLIQDAYAQLHAEGYVTTRGGSATRVAPQAAARPSRPAPTPRPGRAAVAPPAQRPAVADFAAGVPDLAAFPRGDWSWAVRESLRTVPDAALDYGDPRGAGELRQVLAGYLRRARAAATAADRIVVCGGFAQGLGLALRVLVRAGVQRVAFEDPGYGDGVTMAAARWAGVEPVPVPVDPYGIDVRALHASGARAVVVTPAHQWPTGVVLSPRRRQALAAWAERRGGMIVEDDYDAPFRYDRDPVGTLQGLAPDHVILIGTVSTSLAPALRLGWLACPPVLAGEIAAEKRLTDRGAPLLDQLALAALIDSGRFDRHVRRMRTVYRRRRETLAAALAAHAPGVRLTGAAAGFHTVAHLPAGTTEAAVTAAARTRGVGLHGMSAYRADRAAGPPRLVLGFGNVREPAIRRGVAVIGDVVSGARD